MCSLAYTSCGRPHLLAFRTASASCFTPTTLPMLSNTPGSPSHTETAGRNRHRGAFRHGAFPVRQSGIGSQVRLASRYCEIHHSSPWR